jgi:hypothetical protein
MKLWAMLLAAASLTLFSQVSYAQPAPGVRATVARTPVPKPPGAPVITNPRTPPSRN